MIEIPLNEISIEQNETESIVLIEDKVFDPIVTSKIPCNMPERLFFDIWQICDNGERMFISRLNIPRASKISAKRKNIVMYAPTVKSEVIV